MTDYLRVRDTDSVVVGIGSPAKIAISGETVYEVADGVTIDTERILRGATVTITGGKVSAVAYPAAVDRAVEKMIGRVQAVVEEVIEINRRLPITGAVSREAMEATESWAVHLGGAGRLVAHNRVTGVTLDVAGQEAAVAQLETMPGSTRTWNGVMRAATGANNIRDTWRTFSYGERAAVYVDCLTTQARPRRIDGAADIILPGGFPANFNPHAIT